MLDDSLLKKIDDALSCRFLIGDINFNIEEKEAIREEFFSVYSKNSKGNWKDQLSNYELDIISITLILVAKNYPKDWRGKEFWPKIAERINVYASNIEVEMPLPYNVLTQIKDRLADPFRRRVFFKSKQGHQQYVQSIMFQAYAPKTSIEAFIKLVWTLYCSVFSFSYDDKADRELCDEIVDKLAKKNSMDADLEDDVQIGGSFYQIRAALKYGFAQDPASSTLLLRRILDYTNKIYLEKKDLALKAEDDYLAGLVENTVRGLLTPSLRKRKHNRSLPTVNKSAEITPSFIVSNQGKLELVTNSIRLDEGFIGAKEAVLKVWPVLNGKTLGNPICCSNPIVASDFIPMVEELKVCIEPLLRIPSQSICLHVVLDVDGKAIYEKDIERFFILVKGKHEVIGDCHPDSYTLYFSNLFNVSQCLKIKEGFEKTGPNSISFISNSGDYITSKEQSVSFRSSNDDIVFSFGPATADTGITATIQENGKEDIVYSVYRKMDFLVISSGKKENLEKTQVELVSDGITSYLKLAGTLKSSGNSITIDLSGLVPEKRYTLKISKIDNKGTVLFLREPMYFIISPSAGYSFQNTKTIVPYGDDTLNMQWKFLCFVGTEIVKEGKSPAVIDFTVYNFKDPNNHRIQFKKKEYEEGFLREDENLKLSFEIPYFKWALDENEPVSSPLNSAIWHGDIYNNELIHVESSEDFKIFVNDTPLSPAKKKGYFMLSNAFYNQSANEDCIVNAKIFRSGKEQSIVLLKITRYPKFYLKNGVKELFDETEEGTKLLFSNCYCGPSDTLFQIVLKPKHITNKPIEFQGNYCATDTFPTLGHIPDNEYKITITAEYSHPNSIEKSKSILINDEDILIGSENGFLYEGVNSLKFKKYRCPNGMQQKFKKNPISITNIHYIEDDELPIYSGKLKLGKGKPMDVFFKSKSEDNILLYYKDGEELKPMSCTSDGTDFVKCSPDEQKYFTSRSIYCEVK
ncbi:MAG TPA: hypothetical protein DCZ41_03970 [Firmicutes bacterium]|nr:hypothetical protein [Bacillota bacterium]